MAVVGIALAVMAISCSGDADDERSIGEGCSTSVHVFVELGETKQREERIGQVIDGVEGVRDWSFHSNVEAYREFKKLYREEREIYESKQPADFPSRFEVTLEPPQTIEGFETALEGATTGIDRLVPGGCATETPAT